MGKEDGLTVRLCARCADDNLRWVHQPGSISQPSCQQGMEVNLPHRSPPVAAMGRPASDWNPEQIWDEFRNGSELAFTALYKMYVADLYHYGERLTDDKQLIEDSIHDLFVELWRQRSRYKPVQRLKFYLLKS